MKDTLGREIDYMRISITDRCNLRCRYCVPEGIAWTPMAELLSYEEIKTVCEEAVALGIHSFKITGGEPLVRRESAKLVGMLKELPGTRQVTMTTNGVLLGQYLPELIAAGLDAVNVSLDTLDPLVYKQITGCDAFAAVIKALQQTAQSPLRVKINTVLQSGINDQEWDQLFQFAQSLHADIRFIEMMPIGSGSACQGVSNQQLWARFCEKYPNLERDQTVHGNGPAVYYKLPGATHSVGFISAIHGKFCASCNRIRMTTVGKLKACLCYQEELSVREAVRAGDRQQIRRILQATIRNKPAQHCFDQYEEITECHKMVQIGG